MRRILLVGIVGVVGTGALAAAGSPEPITRATPADQIVFTRPSKAGHGDLYVIAADASRPRLLIRNAADAAVSPNGRLIAFVRDGGVWVMRRDGSKQRQLTKATRPESKTAAASMRDSSPAWSPSGTTLYFSHETDTNGTTPIFSIRPDGTHRARLTRPSADECHEGSSTSPAGLITFMDFGYCPRWEEVSLQTITKSGRRAQLPFAIPTQGNTYDPAWSRDGRQLAYGYVDPVALDSRGDRAGASGVYVSRSDGSRPHRIASGFQYSYEPAWAPDGKWIAFDGPNGVALMRSDGTGAHMLAYNGSDPAWLPHR